MGGLLVVHSFTCNISLPSMGSFYHGWHVSLFVGGNYLPSYPSIFDGAECYGFLLAVWNVDSTLRFSVSRLCNVSPICAVRWYIIQVEEPGQVWWTGR